MLMLNSPRGEEGIEKISGITFIDSFLNEYLLSLGEFDTDAYKEHPNSALCWIFFVAATFLIQITALNMLIALMGDTFDRVIEQRR